MCNIIICVFACATIDKYKQELLKVIDTWGQRALQKNIKVFYFLGEEKTEFIGDHFIYLQGVDNSYYSASLKQNLGLKYIYDHFNPDYVLVCGTDTYINIDHLTNYLHLHQNTGDYIGGGGLNPLYFNMDKQYYYHSGAGFILSRKALSYLSPFLQNMFIFWLQQCIKYNTHYLIPACDACIGYYVQQYDIKIIKEPTLFYGCNYKGYDRGKFCCGSNVDYKKIILCHYMTVDDFDEYTKILVDNHYFI